VADFRQSDLHAIEQTRIAIRSQHYHDMPRSDGGIGALGVLNGEFAKKRNHLSIRQLVKRAGSAMQALKPVFMMSPLSVAQFLEPGALQFDLLVMDEASQVEPVDALGAIARAKQIVVVGDERQLPPTRFFSRMTGNADDDPEDEGNTVAAHDVESILNLCLARGLPQRMLRWHYRSRHQSLIAVSNREFYENKLFIVPSPYDAASGMGLKFHHLPHGTFDSGGTATNPVEAKAVAEAVIQHAKEQPGRSLGVGAFSVKQRQAILDQLELLRRAHPETESFFTQAHRDEPFFVKNLENIQGDERDVILISVGYARNPTGYMAMRFGPLSAEGGERRLNVLISRAKRRCEVFSSITADDIDLERAKGAGVAALKLFLKFAETGKLDFERVSDREADSIFEEQVAAALRSRGYDVKMQVGIAGFFIDIAVVDQENLGRFLLGIECDGAAYHSSRSARDRDRLRQAVLEDHGWIIHRIWSTDWFRRPKEQLEKTVAAIEQARKTLAARGEQADVSNPPHRVFEIVSHHDGDSLTLEVNVAEKSLCVPYQEAILPVPLHQEPHELSDSDMAGIISKIVESEGPIHESEVIARVRMLWNLARAGGRIQSKVKAALAVAERQSAVLKDGNFFLKPGAEIRVRDRSLASSASLRKPECLPPHEIQKAILALVEVNFGAGREQLPIEVARLLGFKMTSAQLREVIDAQIQELLNAGKLEETGDHLRVCEAVKMA
jgi:very-short-patch-repair endonuclease